MPRSCGRSRSPYGDGLLGIPNKLARRGRAADDRGRVPSLDVAIDLFLDHIKVERGLARNTVLAYGADLVAFRAHAAEAGVVEAERVTSKEVLAYLVRLAAARASLRTQARRLIALRRLFRYLRLE